MLSFVRSWFFRPWATYSKEDIPNERLGQSPSLWQPAVAEPKPKIIILPKGRHILTPNQLITLACQDHKISCNQEALSGEKSTLEQ